MASNLFGSGTNHRSSDQVKADQDARRAEDKQAANNTKAAQAAGRGRRSI